MLKLKKTDTEKYRDLGVKIGKNFSANCNSKLKQFFSL